MQWQMQAILNPSLGCTAGKGEQEASLGMSHSPNVSPNPVFPAFTLCFINKGYAYTPKGSELILLAVLQGKACSSSTSTAVNTLKLHAFSYRNPLGDGWHERAAPASTAWAARGITFSSSLITAPCKPKRVL